MDQLESHLSAAICAGPGGGPRGGPGGDDEPWRDEPDGAFDAGVDLDERTARPRPYRVLMHNDDYTYREFVVDVLMTHFHKTSSEATHIMLTVHFKGVGECGVFPRDIAETKVATVTTAARAAGMPLKCTMEPA